MIPEGPAFHKPKSIVAAKNILYAALFIGLLSVIIRDSKLGIANNGGIPALILTSIGFLVTILLIKAMNQCKKWARTVLLVLYCCITFAVISTYLHLQLVTGVVESAMLTLQILLQILALFFLYNKESNIWFNKQQQ